MSASAAPPRRRFAPSFGYAKQPQAISSGRLESRTRKSITRSTNSRKKVSWRFKPGKPKTYRVVPPKEVEIRLRRIVEADYERRRAATTRLGVLLEPLRAATRSPATDVAYIVKGIPNIVARAQSLIASARKEIVVLASDEPFFRKVEADLGKAGRRRVRVKLAIPDIQVERDLEKAAEVRSIVCNCLLIIVDAQQVLTMTRTLDGDAYAITSTDPTLVQLGLDYWASPRCCVM